MSLIQTEDSKSPSARVRATYAQIEKAFGRVPNAMAVFSASPTLLEQQWESIQYYRNHPTLGFPLLAMIRMLVSQENRCEYCVGFNAAMLMEVCGLSADQIAAVKRDPANAPLEEKDRAMLNLVLKAVHTPLEVQAADLDRARALGWRDGEIFDAVAHGARNLAVDVIFNTFKIDRDF
ncbi:MAG: carboxymuconolactone decarboxylase family protein [Gammaproteobacteria bacterium]